MGLEFMPLELQLQLLTASFSDTFHNQRAFFLLQYFYFTDSSKI